MPSDIEIAQAAKLQRISKLAQERLGIPEEHLEPYGHYKAKVSLPYLESLKDRKDGKLILVTAMTPTPARRAARCSFRSPSMKRRRTCSPTRRSIRSARFPSSSTAR